MTHILTFYNDFQKYPPIITVITTLLSKGDRVLIFGYCSSSTTIQDLKDKGLEYYEFIIDDPSANSFIKLYRLYAYKKKVLKSISSFNKGDIKLWVFNEQCAWLLHSLFEIYRTVLYLFELPNLKVERRFKLLSPRVNYKLLMQNSYKVVCCEYNRAAITQSYFQLEKEPVIIPNKPSLNVNEIPNLAQVNPNLNELCSNYKVILYQGIFNYPERRLDELCEAIDILPEEFRLVLMGPEDTNKQRLRRSYPSKKIIFVPYLKTPLHLSVTKMSYIGFLSYFSSGLNIQNSLNTLYCAPNKIYEYSLCGIPALSNNSPALKSIFETYKIGEILYDFTAETIVNKVLEIDKNYDKYIDYKLFVDSVKITELITSI